MSGADEQRAAERLRDAVICHCYDIAGPVGGGHWGSCLTGEIGDEVTAVLADRDRLRAKLAETQAAGDGLAAAAVLATVLPRNIEQDEMVKRGGGLKAALAAWRSVRG